MSNTLVPISLLDLAVIREGQSHAEAIEWTVQSARHAEALGYRRIWLAEHHNMPSIASTATAILIGHLASKTEAIPVGSGGIMLPNHSNLSVAEDFGTLASIYPGRIELGLGRAPGTDPLTAQALRPYAPSHMDYDFKANILELQEYFRTKDRAPVRAYIAEGKHVPIYILGSSTDSAWLAAELGLPYAFAAHFAPQQLKIASKIYHQHFQASSWLDKPYFMTCVNVIAADTDAEAEYQASSLYQMFLNIITNSRKPLQAPIPNFEEFLNPQLIEAMQQMLYYTFIGSKHKIREQLLPFIQDVEADEIMTTSYFFELKDRLRNLSLLHEALSL